MIAPRLPSLWLWFWLLPLLPWPSEPVQAAAPPNIVWINCEDLDDTLGCYGDAYATTPHLDRLAREGRRYRNAFANAPICAPARNCLITGMYPTSLGGQHLRCEVTLPPNVKPFPLHLKEAGYFVTNQAKTDYNFSPDGIYDYWKNDLAPWRQRKRPDQPFFSFFVLGTTHEGPGNFRERYEKAVSDLPREQFHDPEKATVPPYFPNTPKMRQLWARYYDLVSAMDAQVGHILDGLKADGLWENTIVWFFSDHGHGLPRHKRWLMDSGLRVPFIVRVPPAFASLAPGLRAGDETHRLVSFVDFAPTVLQLAGLTPPAAMQGRAFLGKSSTPPREFIYGARDRADDMFEVSRAVHDGRYLYVRHFLPHLPYLQGGRIFGNQKESLAELRRARDAGSLDEHSSKLFAERKPVEELYDLQHDPHELHNLAPDPALATRKAALKKALLRWIHAHRDTGFLTESEYTRRARKAGLSIFEMAQSEQHYDLPSVLQAALGEPARGPHTDTGVLYWKLMRRDPEVISPERLRHALQHPNPSVRITAAEVACERGLAERGLPVLLDLIAQDDLRLALEAARTLFLVGEAATPGVDRIEAVRKGLEATGPNPRRRYRDFNYASFTAWALEATLVNCGAASWTDFD